MNKSEQYEKIDKVIHMVDDDIYQAIAFTLNRTEEDKVKHHQELILKCWEVIYGED